MNVLVTGSEGFIGKNLCLALKERGDIVLRTYDMHDTGEHLGDSLGWADIVYHLAGVNRPQHTDEFESGNAGLTQNIVNILAADKKSIPLIMSSSTQAAFDNPYGVSKARAEEAVLRYQADTGARAYVFRLTNVFGKMSRPFYNSVVSTFCHQAARGLEFTVNDPDREISFIYIDDIISVFTGILDGRQPETDGRFCAVKPEYPLTVRELADKINSYSTMRQTCVIPDFANPIDKYLYSTYLTYLEPDEFAYAADKKTDERGYLFELVKSPHAGQIFVSRTKPGITRGNHYHHTKTEKFCVVEGTAKILFRNMMTEEKAEYTVEGSQCRVVDIPPGWTHSITNTGTTDLLTIFWANEIFNPGNPDTFYSEV